MQLIDPVDAARALLPWWVLWGGLFYLPVVFAAAAILTSATALATYRPPGEGHWTERARHVQVARKATNFAGAFSCVVALAYVGLWFHGDVAFVPGRLLAFAAFAAALLGAAFARGRLERRIGMPCSLLAIVRGDAAFILVLLPAILVAAVFASVEPTDVGRTLGAVLIAGTACVLVALWGGGLWVARELGLSRPARPRLVAAVQEAARRAGTRPRPVFEVALRRANALALTHLQRLAFTEPAVDALDDEELCAVAAHELAHLDEPRGVRALRVAVALSIPLGLMALPASAAAFGIVGPCAVVLALVVIIVVFRRTARRMEERADHAARDQEPGELRTYARALERIYEVNLVPAVLGGRPIHPHLYDRLLTAGVQPSYPRPAPPPRGRSWAMLIAPFGAIGLAMAVSGATPKGRHLDERALLARMALTGGDGTELGDLALLRWTAGDSRAAATFYRAEIALGDSGVYPRIRPRHRPRG